MQIWRFIAHGHLTPLAHILCKLNYDAILDAILTCAEMPTWVSLIYRTEPTTKKWKTEKLKSKKTDKTYA